MNPSSFIDIGQLRVGMFVHIDVGWLRHPFPVSSFRIASADQIEILRSLGLERVRYEPEKSDVPSDVDVETEAALDTAAALPPADLTKEPSVESPSVSLEMSPERRLAAQQRRLIDCD